MTALATAPARSFLSTRLQIERADIWWVNFKGSLTGDWKIRPAIVITGNLYATNNRNRNITVVPLSTFREDKDREDEVVIYPDQALGLDRIAITMIASTQSVSRDRLLEWMGNVDEVVLHDIFHCLDTWCDRVVA